MLGVYRTGSRHVGCVLNRTGSRHVVRSIHLNLIDWGLRGCIFRVRVAPGAAMLGVYRTGSRHVGCVSYRKPPC